MITDDIQQLADTVLHEGHLLYPCHGQALKDRQLWLFGTLYPKTYIEQQTHDSERYQFISECLFYTENAAPVLNAQLRFLRRGPTGELIEQSHPLKISQSNQSQTFCQNRLRYQVQRRLTCIKPNYYKLSFIIENLSIPNPQQQITQHQVLSQSLLSTQVIFYLQQGYFISLTDHPHHLETNIAACRNEGLYPILAGDNQYPQYLLALPIITEDFSQIAAQNPALLYNATDYIRAEQDSPYAGRKAKIKPKASTDIFDVTLANKVVTVVKVETNFEGREYFVVTLDDNSGKDLGSTHLYSHRFLFSDNELEWL